MLYLNGEHLGYAIRRCRIPKTYDRIIRNLNIWEQERSIYTLVSVINIKKDIDQAEIDEKLLEILLAIFSERERDDNNRRSSMCSITKEYIQRSWIPMP